MLQVALDRAWYSFIGLDVVPGSAFRSLDGMQRALWKARFSLETCHCEEMMSKCSYSSDIVLVCDGLRCGLNGWGSFGTVRVHTCLLS